MNLNSNKMAKFPTWMPLLLVGGQKDFGENEVVCAGGCGGLGWGEVLSAFILLPTPNHPRLA